MVSQYFPCHGTALDLGAGVLVDAAIEGSYPFSGDVTINLNTTTALDLLVRVPGWAAGATATIIKEKKILTNGTLARLPLTKGISVVTLHFPMMVRLERRGAARQSVSVYRGPLLFGLPVTDAVVVDFTPPYDDRPSRLPKGQAHGRNNYLVNMGLRNNSWPRALVVPEGDDGNNMRVLPLKVEPPPLGQGVWSLATVPIAIEADVRRLRPGVWPLKDGVNATWPYSRRGSAEQCTTDSGGHAHGQTTGWASDPPSSPITPGVVIDGAPERVHLVPFGATDLRLAELPTVLS